MGHFLLLAVMLLTADSPSCSTQYPDFTTIFSNNLGSYQAAAVLDLSNNRLFWHRPEMLGQLHRPGSVFKLVSAAAIMAAGLDGATVTCHGESSFAGQEHEKCWNRQGHGQVGLRQAIAQSCNIYFYTMAGQLGANALWQQLRQWQLDGKTGFYSQEAVPQVARELTPIELRDCAIGDCDRIYLTGFSLLKLAAILSGRWSGAPGLVVPLELTHDMYRVVEQGTAAAARLSQISYAGKTGTARRLDSWRYEGWFIGFVPFENPRYALVVYDAVGQGKDSAAAAARLIRAIYGTAGGPR